MATLNITDADRGPDGRILTERPRSLADLLPPSSAALKPTENPPARQGSPAIRGRTQLAIAGVAGLLLVFALSYLIGTRSPARPAAAPPSPAPSVVAAPTAPPAALPAPAVVAFAAPGGDVLGPVAAASVYHFTGRYGDGWVQSDVPGSGKVWLRRADLTLDGDDLAAIAKLPDLTPPTPAPAPIAPAIVPAAPIPIPTQCAVVGTAAGRASACGTADLDTLQATAQAQLMTSQHLQYATVTTPTPMR